VLGPLPVRAATIVRAKLTALAVYILIVAVAMHLLASVMFGASLATHNTTSMALAGIIAHLVASAGGSAFVFLAIAAMQGVLFAALGARWFRVVSAPIQVAIVTTLLLGLVFLPALDLSVVDTLAGTGRRVHPWILVTPPLWFLGLYEAVLGTDDPVLLRLASLAVGSLIAATIVTVVTYPLAYRRLGSTVVELREPGARAGLVGLMARVLTTVASLRPATRASVQFLIASAARVGQHRFVLAAALGIAIALAIPTLFGMFPTLATPPAYPPRNLLALPLHTMVVLLVGLRMVAALPADLNAGWMLSCIDAPPRALRAGVWRVMFLVGVLPVVLLAMPVYWIIWGASVALPHTVVCLAVGAALTEGLLWGFDGMPCARPWRPERANLRTWWPAYLAGFFLVTAALPAVESICFEDRTGFTALAALIGGLALTLRVAHRRRRIMPEDALDEPAPVQVLNLD